MSRRGVRWLLLVCALLVPAGSVAAVPSGAGGAADLGGGDGAGPADATVGAGAVQDGTSNNSTVRHRDPDEVREEGDVEDLRRWLVGRLTDRLGEGAVQLSEGEYERARRLVGDEYDERLDQLVDVAGETETTRTLRDTRENQRETSEAVEEYRETYEEYREARRNGNNQRARELGRDLERQSRRVNENADETTEGYDELGNRTGEDFAEPQEAVENVSENVSETQEEVRQAIFTETNLTVSADGERVSFVDPLAISGRLTTENGTAVGNETIELRVGDRTVATDTDADGGFAVDYRPVTLPANATEVTVEFRPSGESEYLNSSGNVAIDVETVEPNVTVAEASDRVAYNETLTVAGRVSADDVGAPAPVAVYVGDRRVGTTNATANGSYEVRARLPADVPDGERTVRAVVDQEGRALERADATANATVEETATDLTARAGTNGNATVRVTGRLTTADGDGLAGRTVRIERDGQAVESVTTNASGGYNATLSIPADAAGETVAVTAAFEEQETNLEPSSARATVTLPEDWAGAGAGDGSGGPLEVGLIEWLSGVLNGGEGDGVGAVVRSFALAHPLLVGAFVLGVVLLAGAGGYAVLTGRGPFGAEDEGIEGVEEPAPDDAAGGDESSSRDVVAALLDRAREQVAGGAADAGVITAYTAVRQRLADRESGEGHTHWEFYRRHRDALDEETASVLRDLTEAYERAAFAPDTVAADRARDLLERLPVGDREGDGTAAD